MHTQVRCLNPRVEELCNEQTFTLWEQCIFISPELPVGVISCNNFS